MGAFRRVSCRRRATYVIEKSGNCLSYKVIMPRHLRQSLLRTYLEGIGGGHLCFEKTYLKLKERFHWPRIKEDTKLLCYNCMRCGARKCTNHALRATLLPMEAGFPFELNAMEIVGPDSEDAAQQSLLVGRHRLLYSLAWGFRSWASRRALCGDKTGIWRDWPLRCTIFHPQWSRH